MLYKAFMSYSHAADGKLAPALQSALHRFAKPWYRLRAIRVFRDKTTLSVTPALWPSIEKALSESEYFILLASPEAAASRWVQQEVDYWLKNRSAEKILILLTDGEIAWHRATGDFDWSKTTAILPNLRAAFPAEPLYLDLRWARAEEHLSLRNPRFRDSIADVAATLHGRPKDEIVGEDIRQHRRTRRLVWSAVIALVVLTVSSISAAWYANRQRQEAERQRRIAFARQLAAQAEARRTQQANLLQESVALAVRSMRESPSLEAYQTLRNALTLLPRPVVRIGHKDNVTAVAFSPEGQFVATGSYDRTARIREASGLKNMVPRELNHQGVVWAVAFSRDGKYLATASWDGSAAVWETFSGELVLRLPHENAVTAVSFSPDGRFLATASEDKTARVWELTTGREIRRMTHQDSVNGIAFSPDGKSLVTVSDDKTARVWELTTGREVRQMTHEAGVTGVSLSPDGKSLATASRNGVAQVWDLVSGRKAAPQMTHEGVIWSLTFSPDGKFLATASRDKTARVWEVRSGDEIARMTHEDFVWRVTFSPDGRYLGTASRDRTARVWKLPTGVEIARMIHKDSVISIAFSPDGKYLATASEDKDRTAQVWELPIGRVGRPEKQFEKEITQGNVEAISLSPDGNFLATAARDNAARVWDLTDDSAKMWEKDRLAHNDYVIGVAFSPDGKYLATASWDKTARVWDLTNAQQVVRIPHDSEVDAVAFSPDGSLLATASADKMVQVWDLPSGRVVAPPLKLEGAIQALTFSPDGKYLVAGGEGKASLLWEVSSGRQIASTIHTGSVTGVVFSPDGQYMAAASNDNTLRVWKVPSGKKVSQMPEDGLVKAMAFSADGRLLATAGLNGANVWDIATGEKIARISPGYDLQGIAFSSDQKYLVALGRDRKVRLWHLLWPEDLINEACQRLTVVACEPSAAMEPSRLSSVLFPIVSTLAPTLPGSFSSNAFAQEDLRPPVTPTVQATTKTSSYRVQIRRNGGLVSFSALNEDGTEAGRSDSSGRGVILAPATYNLRADQFEVKEIILPASCVSSLTEGDLPAGLYVNPRNANLVVAYADGPLRRIYNSRSVYTGPLGFGWTFGSSRWAFGSRLEREREGGLKIIEVDGHMTVYQGNTTALHVSSDPFHSVLVEEAGRLIRKMRDHGYQKRYGPDVKVEVFDSQGRLRSVQYWNGEAHEMHYQGDSLQAQAIVNQWTGGTMLSFEWKNNHIVKARDSTGQSFQYGYEGDHLVSVTAPDGSITRYRYDEFYNLIEIVFPQGDRRVFDYDQRRDFLVGMQVAGMNYRFKYGQESVHHYWTIRTDSRGNLVRWDFHGDTTLVTTAKCLDEKPG